MKKLSCMMFVALIALGAWGVAEVSGQTAFVVDVPPFLVKGGAGSQIDGHLSGSLLVFTDRTTAGSVIRYRDLAVPGSEPQAIPGEGVLDSLPDVFGTNVVFIRRPLDTSEAAVMWFDAANPLLPPIELSPAPGAPRNDPAIGGDTVAFVQYATTIRTVGDICVASLSDPLAPETCLTNDAATVRNESAAVTPDGNTVVWQKCDVPGTSCDIYISRRDLATRTWGPQQLLVDTGGSEMFPDTDGRFVAWAMQTWLPGEQRWTCAIDYMALTGTPAPQPIAGGDTDCSSRPRISRGAVVFEAVSGDGITQDIFLTDLSTGTTNVARGTAIHEVLPDISHDAAGKLWLTWSEVDADLFTDLWAMRLDLTSSQYRVQPLFDQGRSHKAGSVVPIRLQLLDAAGANVSSSSLAVTVTGLIQKDSTAALQLVEDAGNANPDSAFRFDPTLHGYVFNLGTKTLAAGTWELRFTVGGGTREYRVAFDVR